MIRKLVLHASVIVLIPSVSVASSFTVTDLGRLTGDNSAVGVSINARRKWSAYRTSKEVEQGEPFWAVAESTSIWERSVVQAAFRTTSTTTARLSAIQILLQAQHPMHFSTTVRCKT